MCFKKETLIKILPPIIGFGIGGALWGIILYLWRLIDYPLNFIALVMILFGGIGLGWDLKSIKKTLKATGFGIIGGIVGLIVAFFGIYHLPIIGSFIVFLYPSWLIDFSYLSGLGITEYWLNFTLAGFLIGLFFSFSYPKIWPITWRGGVGFGLAAIISPLFGNLLGNLFNSLFLSYLITFSLIGIIFSLFLVWGIEKNK